MYVTAWIITEKMASKPKKRKVGKRDALTRKELVEPLDDIYILTQNSFLAAFDPCQWS